MAEIPVTQKSSSSWWKWLIALLVLAVIVWFIYQALTDERSDAAVAPTSTAPAVLTFAADRPATGSARVNGRATEFSQVS